MNRLRTITGIALLLTFGLILLGAWVRATNSGLSCPDWPTCYGYWLPLPSDIPADAGYAYYQVMLEWGAPSDRRRVSRSADPGDRLALLAVS